VPSKVICKAATRNSGQSVKIGRSAPLPIRVTSPRTAFTSRGLLNADVALDLPSDAESGWGVGG
jgi:hypothetical protein